MAPPLVFVLLLSGAVGQMMLMWLFESFSLLPSKWDAEQRPTPPPACLRTEDGRDLAAEFQRLIRNYSAKAADRLLAPDVVAHCDGMNEMAGKPLGAPTYHDREELKTALERQSGRPTPVTLRTVDVVTCNTVVLKWTAVFGQEKLPVRGIQILTVQKSAPHYGWAIKTIDTEFNSLAYLVDLGGTYSMPN
ncbi:hypothetical protein CGRA01v4_14159 [Colletotrichum graminicola]|uniref:NTF2-like domain-containing protein n=1 Tax=Colletotrichum graminicola (strain M1.001 / M2 / FGSC 10212) TaxID=645133 RepID=E3R0T2_COLGM|nr:uncharacterized protein GLRG_11868 [Colletotrichum graminicola M1.001]EFQ36720.1 hypothetical protein GLRG_11868 [Colletotrichum graminicola M1.001]WDK22868.1 hypothetical protein CGRA01v4_14159 [Colletotrichum graminicola]